MKIKVYTPIVVTITEGSNRPAINCYGAFSSEHEARSMISQVKDNLSVRDNESGQFIEPRQYTGGYTGFKGYVHEEVIDTDDFEEYKPDYDVEIDVMLTKRVTVRVTADDLEMYGFDEDGVDECATAMFEDDCFEEDIACEDVFDSEMDVRDWTPVG